MEMQNLSDERYFIVFLACSIKDKKFYRNIGYINSGYINKAEFITYVKEKIGLDGVDITNIIELNKKDYDCYFE